MTADELWEKYCKPEMIDNHFYDVMREKDFLAALHAYGNYRAEEVRKRAVSVLNELETIPDGIIPGLRRYPYSKECADAIERMPLP